MMRRLIWLTVLVMLAACSGEIVDIPEDASSESPPQEESAEAQDAPQMVPAPVMIDSVEVLGGGSQVLIMGSLPNGCATLTGIEQQPLTDSTIQLLVTAEQEVGEACTEALVPFEEVVTLDTLNFQRDTTYTLQVTGANDPITATFVYQAQSDAVYPTDQCPRPVEGQVEIVLDALQICFLAPEGFRAQITDEASAVVSDGATTLTITPVDGDLDTLAEEELGPDARATELGQQSARISDDGSTRAAVVTGEGRSFTLALEPMDEPGGEALWELLTESFTVFQLVTGDPIRPTEVTCEPEPEGLTLLEDDALCLFYPEGYTSQMGDGLVASLDGPVEDDSELPVTLTIEDIGPSEGRSAADYADRAQEQAGGEPMARSETTIGGFPAVILEGLPGMLTSREAYVVAGARAYRITLFPVDADMEPEKTEEALALWETVIPSIIWR